MGKAPNRALNGQGKEEVEGVVEVEEVQAVIKVQHPSVADRLDIDISASTILAVID